MPDDPWRFLTDEELVEVDALLRDPPEPEPAQGCCRALVRFLAEPGPLVDPAYTSPLADAWWDSGRPGVPFAGDPARAVCPHCGRPRELVEVVAITGRPADDDPHSR